MIKKILVSQPEPSSEKSPYHEIAGNLGVDFTFRPFVKVEAIEAREFRAQKVNILDHTAVVFNSKNAIDHFFNLCKELRITLPEDMKYFGISEKVILYIQKYVQYRKRKVFYGTSGRWPELLTVMGKHKNEKYLIPHGEDTSLEVAGQFYKDYDLILLFTPVGVQSLINNFPDFKQGDIRLGCFGDATAKAMEDAGLRVDLKVTGSIAEGLDTYIREVNR